MGNTGLEESSSCFFWSPPQMKSYQNLPLNPGSITPIPVWTLPPRFRSEPKPPIRFSFKMHSRIRSPLWFPNTLLIWGILCILWLYLFGTTMGFWIVFQICQQLGEEMYHWIAWRTIVREYTANFFFWSFSSAVVSLTVMSALASQHLSADSSSDKSQS